MKNRTLRAPVDELRALLDELVRDLGELLDCVGHGDGDDGFACLIW